MVVLAAAFFLVLLDPGAFTEVVLFAICSDCLGCFSFRAAMRLEHRRGGIILGEQG
jgi:hypothetical protein